MENTADKYMWRSEFSVSNALIDAQHRRILDILYNLRNCIERNDPHSVKNVVNDLVHYTREHFDTEEAFMRLADYPSFLEHKTLHEDLKRKTLAFRNEWEYGDEWKLLDFLGGWWVSHILTEDKGYFPGVADSVSLLKDVALFLKENERSIFSAWAVYEGTVFEKNEDVSRGMKILFSYFITDMAAGDIPAYYARIRALARELTEKDIPFEQSKEAFRYLRKAWDESLKGYGNAPGAFAAHALINDIYTETLAILGKEQYDMMDGTIVALAKIADYRDPETGGHLQRTKNYSRLLAEYLDCEPRFIEDIFNYSPLHDIGKVGISDGILLKPGKLTKDEFMIMKTHAQIGADTIHEIIGSLNYTKARLAMAKDIALGHHERWDGTGYPRGLKGEEIPLAARIFTVSNIYDALVSDRPYKRAFSHEEAVEIILRGDPVERGRTMPQHFDPQVLEAFDKLQYEFHAIAENYKG